MRVRSIITAGFTGLFLVTSAWAGVGISPVPTSPPPVIAASTATPPEARTGISSELGADELLVGAAKVNIAPQPDASKGEVWEKNKAKCTPATSGDVQGTAAVVTDTKLPWPENPNCIYAGGFGVGPAQPLAAFDTTYGLWSRSVAFQRNGQTLVLTVLDAEGWFAKYNKMCPPELACGAFDLAEQLGKEFGADPAGFVFASTHSHAGPDFIGGFGGVPTWYMRQVAEAMRESVRQAIRSAQPATLVAGDTMARHLNSERRDLSWSAEDPSVNWVRAIARGGSTIATAATYSAHPVAFGASATVAHADWHGTFAKAVEDRFGGIGLAFPAGLGNMSARNNGQGVMGAALAALLPDTGTLVQAPAVSVKQHRWDQPVTNLVLGPAGALGAFDRAVSGPGAVSAGKSGARPCASASAVSVHTSVTAAKIGGLYVTAAPGEIFSNASNTIEEKAPVTALAIGQANDGLGYLPQSFEFDALTQQGLGFRQENIGGAGPAWEYEEAYGLDRCFGDMALATQLKLLGH